MLTVVISLILIFLAIQVLPVALGISVGTNFIKAFLIPVLITVTQLLTFWIGLRLGSTFMDLMDGFDNVVVFIGFVLVGIRMLMEVFNIRKGERTYSIDSVGHIALASTAQGINSFLVGLMFYYLHTDEQYMLGVLAIATIIFSVVGLVMKPGKLTLAFASLLTTIGGLIMLFSAVYFSFFYL